MTEAERTKKLNDLDNELIEFSNKVSKITDRVESKDTDKLLQLQFDILGVRLEIIQLIAGK